MISAQEVKQEFEKSSVKMTGFDFWKVRLNSAKYILAPMVNLKIL
jgi:hypothetical protein